MNLGAWESLDEEDETFEKVAVLGYFRGRYYVTTCLVDGDRRMTAVGGSWSGAPRRRSSAFRRPLVGAFSPRR